MAHLSRLCGHRGTSASFREPARCLHFWEEPDFFSDRELAGRPPRGVYLCLCQRRCQDPAPGEDGGGHRALGAPGTKCGPRQNASPSRSGAHAGKGGAQDVGPAGGRDRAGWQGTGPKGQAPGALCLGRAFELDLRAGVGKGAQDTAPAPPSIHRWGLDSRMLTSGVTGRLLWRALCHVTNRVTWPLSCWCEPGTEGW